VRKVKTNTPSDCLQDLRALRTQYGTSNFDHALRTLKRERLENYKREPRQKFPPKMYQRLFDLQKGVCKFCGNHLDVPAKRNELDHIDPARQDFNAPSNLQLLHPACNRVKSCRMLYEQSKLTGKPVSEILKPPNHQEEV